ncbi:hypothetical protein GF407_13805 [candidate division KSB1 bacterium]|nr:hypothetical protein [candidate division KSB1 bacterium]
MELKRLCILAVTGAILISGLPLFSQNIPLKITIGPTLQSQTEIYKAGKAQGYGVGAQMSFILSNRLDFNLKLSYDYMALNQEDVLDEWEWQYWEDTYIDFLPGTDAEIVNKTLSYTSTDSIYSARFNPTQRLEELRLFAGFAYTLPLYKSISLYAGMDAGFSLFTRQLHMQEHWTKRFKLDSLSTGKFDYDFEYDLTHFAPPKKGAKLFASPYMGIKVTLRPSIDLAMGVHYLYYLNRDSLLGIGLSEDGIKWFPIKSKALITTGLVFKY